VIHLKQKALFNWSGGKDSSLCLYHALKDEQFDIQYLLTTLNGKYKRISMHGVSEDLLDKQVESAITKNISSRIPKHGRI
jgi:diphthamide synthase (EF-2-diphthine--ammonia ligase)